MVAICDLEKSSLDITFCDFKISPSLELTTCAGSFDAPNSGAKVQKNFEIFKYI